MPNTQSTWILNRIAQPQVINNPLTGQGPTVTWLLPAVNVVSTSVTNDTFEVCRVPVNARIIALDIANACFAATTFTFNIGLFQALPGGTTAFASATGDASALALGIAFGTAATPIWTPRLGTGTKPTVANEGAYAWQMAGATADPSTQGPSPGPFQEYTIVATASTISGAVTAGLMAFRIAYL